MGGRAVPRFLLENSLSLVMFSVFMVVLLFQSLAGWSQYNEEQREHREPQAGYADYVTSGNFVESVFENWESEFLQMSAYVFLTVFLVQKGSPESRKLEGREEVDRPPQGSRRKDAPWPVRRGGFVLKLYENSLSLALFLLFLVSFVLHAAGGAREYSDEQRAHGQPGVSTLTYMGRSRFWFESFENWQSEFLSVGVLVVLSVFLRQKGSPESKPVDHPHSETGR